MKKIDQEKDANITCVECGKTNGTVVIGTSWICEDCKVSEDVNLTPTPASTK